MKTETKLWLRKKTLMTLRAIIWRADEWLHRQEVKLREELSLQDKQDVPARVTASGCTIGSSESPFRGGVGSAAPARKTETFQQWEARRSGIAVVSNKEARRRRPLSASAFDLRFSQR